MEIRMMQAADIPSVCSLVRQVFDQALAPDYTQEGKRTFYAFIEEEAMRSRLADSGF